jgi:hypothetical protein
VALNRTVESKNKALVLEAFDTLFNKRDYAAAERYWSPHYIQHSAHIEPGREGLFNLVKGAPPSFASKAEFLSNIGTCFRTKLRRSNQRAACLCSATSSRPKFSTSCFSGFAMLRSF